MAVALPTPHIYIGFAQGANPNSWVLGTGALGSTTALGAALTYTYTDVGADVRMLSTQRGKSNERGEYQAGTARVVLDNRARDYDPLNADSPYNGSSFPTVEEVTESNFAEATSHAVPMPTTVNAGDLILVLISSDGSTSMTKPTDWTQLQSQQATSGDRLGIYAIEADGTEGGTTVDFVTGSNEHAVAHTYRISGWYGGDIASSVEIGTMSMAASSNPDPPSLTASWGAEQNLWIAVMNSDQDPATAGPTDWSGFLNESVNGAPAGADIASAYLESEVATVDPGAFTVVSTGGGGAQTIVIRPAVSAGTNIKPGKPIYITLEIDSVEYTIFTGRIRKWELDYTGGFDSTATILCSDAMAELNTTTVDLTTSAADTGTNAAEVLVDAGLTNFTTSTGSTSTQAMTFSGTALAALRVLEKSEQGALYVETNGDIVFSTRTALVDETRSNTVQATFEGSGTLQYTNIAFEYDGDSDVRNSVKTTRQGGSEQTALNQDSIDIYGVKAYSLTGLANVSDSSALGLAEYIAAHYGDVYARISEITLAPMTNSSLMLQACTRRIRDRVRVNFSPVGGGDPISQEAHIIGIKHSIDQQHRMTTTFQLESATASDAVWRLGYGELGSTTVLSF